MKKILYLLLMCSVVAHAQQEVAIKFIRPSKLAGSAAKIRIFVDDNEYVIKNGSEVTVLLSHDYSKPIQILCKAPGGKASYNLKAIPNEKYTFETGFEFKGIYLKLIEGRELGVGETLQIMDSSQVNGNNNPTFKIQRKGEAVGFNIEQVDPSESIRQEWLARGGKVKNESVLLTGTYFGMDLKDFNTRVDGYGGGVSTSTNWINLKIPEYKTGISTWNSFTYGWGIDMILYQYKFDLDLGDGGSTNMSMLNLSYPIAANLGWTVGLGKFLNEGNWKGVALTFKYRPSITLNVVSTTTTLNLPPPLNTSETTYNSDTNASINFGGFGFDFEFSNFTATMDKLAPKPKTKLSFFVLPPVDDTPLFISISIGVSWYSK
ncbi:hypothetical protein [Tenuifilum thalassicum]|uniref:Uncharacterized protein n=1 Tax=Tenuifilum thalassicum TaxID=2590900 RepID=A0A7D4AYH5_9BACT|nr:hypothetical protein [Tenuifilum thalassicum]QKG80874.1 hypothetical protein FHG85_11565 [Tenuifilum thalassicum]